MSNPLELATAVADAVVGEARHTLEEHDPFLVLSLDDIHRMVVDAVLSTLRAVLAP